MKRVQIFITIAIFSFLIIFECQGKWKIPPRDSISLQNTDSEIMIIKKAKHLIALQHYKYFGGNDLPEFEKQIYFHKFIESPFSKTKFLVFSWRGMDPSPSFLMSAFGDSVLELRFDQSNDIFFNNRLLFEPEYDKTKFIEFTLFYSSLSSYNYDDSKILTSWKEIEFDEKDTIPDELKKQIQPLSADIAGNEIKVKYYVWKILGRDLIEMNFVYKNGKYRVKSKLLGKFGKHYFIM